MTLASHRDCSSFELTSTTTLCSFALKSSFKVQLPMLKKPDDKLLEGSETTIYTTPPWLGLSPREQCI